MAEGARVVRQAELMTIRQIATLSGVPLITLYNAVGTDRFPVCPAATNPMRWDALAVSEWMTSDPPFLRRAICSDGTFRCIRCNNRKNISEFAKKNTITGFSLVCDSCRLIPKINYEKANVQIQKKRRRSWQRKNRSSVHGRAKSLCQCARARGAVSKEIENRVLQGLKGGVCELSCIPFDLTLGEGRKPFAPSVDRRNNEQGYTAENVQIVCNMYNMGKSNHNELDFIAMCVAVAERHANDPRVIERLKELRGE